MNEGQKEEVIKSFPLQWQSEALTQCREVGGLLRHLRTAAGLNGRYTKLDSDKAIGLDKFIRIEMNKAMLQDHDEFMREWDIMGEQLYAFGNEYGDVFNLLHKRKKTKT